MGNDQNEKVWYRKPAGLLVFLLITVILTIFKLYFGEEQKDNLSPEKINMESTVPVTISGFQLYTDKSKGLQVLFPGQPEVTTFELGGYPVTHYKALSLIDENNFTQYSVTYTDTEIYSTSSIDSYLSNFPKGKIIGLGRDAKVVTSEIIQYKGFPALEYLIEYSSEGVLIKNRAIVFIANGDPVDLSVSYPATTNANNIHFEKFIKSFFLK